MIEDCFYTLERGAHGEPRFFATEHTRGPWDNDYQHGGPPTALLARAIEAAPSRLPAPGGLITRIGVELLRPVPIAAPLEVRVEELSAGRRVQRLAATLVSGERTLAVATATRIRLEEVPVEYRELPAERLPEVEGCPALVFDFFRHEIAFHRAIDVRIAHGEVGSGAMAVWMRPRFPLVAGEPTTALQRTMICADAGHGVSAALDTTRWSFVNPDVHLFLHRLPEGEWLGMDARTFTGPMGIGMCRTRLLDGRGELGIVLQSQLLDSIA